MKELFCPTCMEDREVRVEQIDEFLTVKEDEFRVVSNVAFCGICNSQLYDEELDGENLDRAYKMYRDKHKLLSPVEIAALREEYGLSQKAFARLLGWGEITIHRYERGSIPDKAHNSLLSLLTDPSVMASYIAEYADIIDPKIYGKVNARLAQLLSTDRESEYELAYQNLLSDETADILSGHIAFSLSKMVNMIRFFANELGGVFKTKMNKLLWYADFIHFKDFSVSISGSRYRAIQHGPVPENFDIIFAEMLRNGEIDIEEKFFVGGSDEEDYSGEVIHSHENSTAVKFSDSEAGVLTYVVSTFGKMSSRKISNTSHDEKAYEETEKKAFIPYGLANKMKWTTVVDDKATS